MPDKAALEKYAMTISTLEETQESLDGKVEIDEVTMKLCIPHPYGRRLAMHLQRMGWVVLNFANDPPTAALTIKGMEEVDKLRMPFLRRFWAQHSGAIVTTAIGTAGALITAAIHHFSTAP